MTHLFAPQIRIWDRQQYDVVATADVGFPITGVAFSNEEYGCITYEKTRYGMHP